MSAGSGNSRCESASRLNRRDQVKRGSPQKGIPLFYADQSPINPLERKPPEAHLLEISARNFCRVSFVRLP
jgi:hypothetical protein